MKKVSAILLLLLILYQLVGYYSIHHFQVYRIKKDVKKQIKNSIPQDQLTSISYTLSEIDKINWVEKDKEFIFEGVMYDVVKVKMTDSIITFFCIADFKETELFAKLDSYVNKYIASNPKQQKKSSLVFSKFQLIFLLQKQIISKPDIAKDNKLNPLFKIQNYLAFLSVESPPPKFHF